MQVGSFSQTVDSHASDRVKSKENALGSIHFFKRKVAYKQVQLPQRDDKPNCKDLTAGWDLWCKPVGKLAIW
jgi:hypothetical protein